MIHPVDAITMVLKSFLPGSKHRAIDITILSDIREAFASTAIEAMNHDALATSGPIFLTYLRIEGFASQAFFQLFLADQSEDPLFPALTSFSLHRDPDVQNE